MSRGDLTTKTFSEQKPRSSSLTAAEHETVFQFDDASYFINVYSAQGTMLARLRRHPLAKRVETHYDEARRVTGETGALQSDVQHGLAQWTKPAISLGHRKGVTTRDFEMLVPHGKIFHFAHIAHVEEDHMRNGLRKFEPQSDYFKYEKVGGSIEGQLLAPITRNNLKGEPRDRHRIRLASGKVKILPDNAYQNGALDEVLQEFGAGGAWVQVTWTGEKPSKKGHPMKVFDVFAERYNTVETAADGNLFNHPMPA